MDKFNIKNLRYDKIILLTDADSDGKHIDLLLMTLFIKYFPELVASGKIYKARTPLFKVTKGSKSKFLFTNQEMQNYLGEFGTPDYSHRYKGLGENSVEELKETVCNVETRQLVQLTTDSMEDILEFYDILMGKDSKKKLDVLVKNSIIGGHYE